MSEPPRGQADLASPVEVARSRSRDYLILLRTPSYVLCTLGMAAMTFAFSGIGLWMPYYLAHRPGTGTSPATTFGVILALLSFVSCSIWWRHDSAIRNGSIRGIESPVQFRPSRNLRFLPMESRGASLPG